MSEVVAVDVLVTVLIVRLIHKLLQVEWLVLLELQLHSNSAPLGVRKECGLLLPELLILHFHLQLLLLLDLALGCELLVLLVAFYSFILARPKLLDQASSN